MKTESKYFKMTINAQSEMELEKRIKDSEKRGFELVSVHGIHHEDRVYGRKEYRGVNIRKTLRAIMRRKNKEAEENETRK